MQFKEKCTLEHKEDTWKIPKETRTLIVNCKLSLHAAKEIIQKCRELERVYFSPHSYELTEKKVKSYLEELVFTKISGREIEYDINRELHKQIQKLWRRGDRNIEHISEKVNIPKEEVYHIIHEKSPEHAKEEKNKHGK